MYDRFIKRTIDIIIALFVWIIFSIPMLIIAIAIKCDSKGPVLFRQKRIGKGGKVFEMVKFRSMRVNSEFSGSGVYSNNSDNRITKVGKFLRATSLDELPQIGINVLRGDMSLIGPRPPLTYHPWKYEEYTDRQKMMFNVRPGLTGWAQVHGRREVEWHKRIEYSIYYVEHESFLLDAKIFFLTISQVLRNRNNENKGKTVETQHTEENKNVEVDVHNQ